jgi:hypothetical protein
MSDGAKSIMDNPVNATLQIALLVYFGVASVKGKRCLIYVGICDEKG